MAVLWWREQLREIYTAPLVVWSVLVAYGSLSPPSRLPSLGWDWSDKAGHGLMYAVLAVLMARSWVRRERATAIATAVTIAICTVWGGYLEGLQALTPDRSFEIGDIIANTLGASIGIFIWLFWRRMRDHPGDIKISSD